MESYPHFHSSHHLTHTSTAMNSQQIHLVKARETWLKVYQELGSVAKAARRCGIARSTLYRWIERFNKLGKEGLKDKSKRPHKLFRLKVIDEQEQLILSITKKYKYGQKMDLMQDIIGPSSVLICSGITS
jgi:transposase